MESVRQWNTARRSSHRHKRIAGSGISLGVLLAIAGCSGEAGQFDTSEPGGERIGSAQQAITLECEGAAQGCNGLSPQNCIYQRGCSLSSTGSCNGIAMDCPLLTKDQCANQLGCVSPNVGQGPVGPPPPSPVILSVPRTVFLGNIAEVAYMAPGTSSPLSERYEAQLSTSRPGTFVTTPWQLVDTYKLGLEDSFWIRPEKQGITRYWLRLCGSSCSPAQEFTIEAYPNSSNLYATYDEAPVSEEGTGVRVCPEGTGVVGLGCSYKFCDNVTLRCGDPARSTLPTSTRTRSDLTWTSFFSEEGDSTRICAEGSMMVGIECYGDYCDSIRLACAPQRANSHRRNCTWSGYYSEESGPFVSAKNSAVFGAQCRGSYCDDKRYYTCEIADGPKPPPPPPPPDGAACTWVPYTSAAADGGVVYVSRPQGACPYSYREQYHSSSGQLVRTVYR